MKVIFFAHKLARGGVEKIISLLTQNLPDTIDSTIVLFDEEVTYSYRGELITLSTPQKSGFLGRILTLKGRLGEFRKVIARIRPQYVVAFSSASGLVSALLSVPLIFTIHTIPSMSIGKNRLQKAMLRYICKKAKAIIVVSDGIRKDLEETYGITEKIQVLYNPVDLAGIEKQKIKEGLDPVFSQWKEQGIPIFITAGTLREQKGHHVVLQAFAQVRKQMDAKLVILGSGEGEAELKSLVQHLSLEDSVLFLGFQENPYRYLARSDVFVFAPLFEGFGIVLVEAMACGLPCIVTDCYSGPREILEPDFKGEEIQETRKAEYGILTPVSRRKIQDRTALLKQERMMADTMLEVIQDQNMREMYKEASFKRAKDFDIIPYVVQWKSILQSDVL